MSDKERWLKLINSIKDEDRKTAVSDYGNTDTGICDSFDIDFGYDLPLKDLAIAHSDSMVDHYINNGYIAIFSPKTTGSCWVLARGYSILSPDYDDGLGGELGKVYDALNYDRRKFLVNLANDLLETQEKERRETVVYVQGHI